jgi:hypothetical protein
MSDDRVFDEPDVTNATIKTIRIEGPLKGPADSWLLGAFLVLFGVAVAAALPPISASIRAAIADAAKGTPGSAQAEHRATVRVRFHIARATQTASAGDGHILSEGAVVAPIAFDSARIEPRLIDLASRIDERGFSARAPPQA